MLECFQEYSGTGRQLYSHKYDFDPTGLMTGFADMSGASYGNGLRYGQPNIIGQTDGVEYGSAASVPPGRKFGQAKFGGGEIGPLYGQPKLGAPGEIPPGQGGNIEGRLKYAEGTRKSYLNSVLSKEIVI